MVPVFSTAPLLSSMNLMLSGLVALQAFTMVGGNVDQWLDRSQARLEQRFSQPADTAPALPAHRMARAADGMFYLAGQAGGAHARLLLDTGASTTILTRADAARLGAVPVAGHAPQRTRTLAGDTELQRARIAELTLAGRRFRNVEVAVADGRLGVSLLGQDVLRRFDEVRISRDAVTLR